MGEGLTLIGDKVPIVATHLIVVKAGCSSRVLRFLFKKHGVFTPADVNLSMVLVLAAALEPVARVDRLRDRVPTYPAPVSLVRRQ